MNRNEVARKLIIGATVATTIFPACTPENPKPTQTPRIVNAIPTRPPRNPSPELSPTPRVIPTIERTSTPGRQELITQYDSIIMEEARKIAIPDEDEISLWKGLYEANLSSITLPPNQRILRQFNNTFGVLAQTKIKDLRDLNQYIQKQHIEFSPSRDIKSTTQQIGSGSQMQWRVNLAEIEILQLQSPESLTFNILSQIKTIQKFEALDTTPKTVDMPAQERFNRIQKKLEDQESYIQFSMSILEELNDAYIVYRGTTDNSVTHSANINFLKNVAVWISFGRDHNNPAWKKYFIEQNNLHINPGQI